MTVIKASVLGYCMGVRRAVDAAEKAIVEQDFKNKKIYTLGPLIHNPTVLDNLQKRGIAILSEENIGQVTADSVVIIRAHGTTPSVMKKLRESNSYIIDATCPRVHLSQKRASEWSQKGYDIIIAGDRNHGEVTSIIGFAKENSVNAIVVQNIEESKSIDIAKKSVLIAQTTFSPEEFERIARVLKEKNKDLVVFNSICSATLERQNALKSLSGKVNGIIVIGGQNSANTRRLFETAETICPAVLLENEDKIPEKFLSMDRVGITAGASTPDEIINKVEEKLKLKNL